MARVHRRPCRVPAVAVVAAEHRHGELSCAEGLAVHEVKAALRDGQLALIEAVGLVNRPLRVVVGELEAVPQPRGLLLRLHRLRRHRRGLCGGRLARLLLAEQLVLEAGEGALLAVELLRQRHRVRRGGVALGLQSVPLHVRPAELVLKGLDGGRWVGSVRCEGERRRGGVVVVVVAAVGVRGIVAAADVSVLKSNEAGLLLELRLKVAQPALKRLILRRYGLRSLNGPAERLRRLRQRAHRRPIARVKGPPSVAATSRAADGAAGEAVVAADRR